MQLDAPVTWHVRDGTLEHSPLRLRGPSGAALDITTQLQAGQLAVRVNGQADLAVAQPFLADTARVSGPVVLDLALATGPDGVTLTGEATVDNARILLREPRLAIDGLTGTLRATGARVELVDVSARVGDGQLTAAGYVTLPATATSTVTANTADRGFDLRVTATGVDLAPFFAPGAGAALEATSTVRVDFSAQLAAPELTLAALDGQGQLTRLELAAGEQALQLDAPVTWSVRDGTLDHSPLRLRGPSGAALDVTTQLQAGQLAVRVNGPGRPRRRATVSRRHRPRQRARRPRPRAGHRPRRRHADAARPASTTAASCCANRGSPSMASPAPCAPPAPASSSSTSPPASVMASSPPPATSLSRPPIRLASTSI